MKITGILFCMLFYTYCQAQQPLDTLVGKKVITLSNVVIDNKLDVPGFIHKIENDSSFYKAFLNLRILGYKAINDVRMLNKKDELIASLHSKTKQYRKHGCRFMNTIEETSTGDFYTDDHKYNYYTAQMYASLFFTKDSVCHETNIVAGTDFNPKSKSGMEKHKEQLKMLFFNPGRRISGLPFMSNKTAIYDDGLADAYDMDIDMDVLDGKPCYIFHQKVKQGKEDRVVVDEMTTWFHVSDMEVMARKYKLSYNAAFYDFKVEMEVQMTQFNGLTVPSLIRYTGNWKAIMKKRERGIFTATLFDFTN
ncbi:MAG: hypothetical protein IPL97_07455 [Niastella sp.]|nr:hypothetical protein [Niastella sp.]